VFSIPRGGTSRPEILVTGYYLDMLDFELDAMTGCHISLSPLGRMTYILFVKRKDHQKGYLMIERIVAELVIHASLCIAHLLRC
jgi:hypothetical protein